MTLGLWFSVAVIFIQIAIWVFDDDALEEWLNKNPFAAKPAQPLFDNVTDQAAAFEAAIADVGV